jgi:signal peptidase I
MHDDDSRAERWEQHGKTVVLAVALAFGLRVGIAQAYEIDGPSMEPTVFQNERVLVARCAYGLSLPYLDEMLVQWSAPAAGDVVIVQSPRDPLDLVKRVIGVPGDVVSVENGVIRRNGQRIVQEEIGPCERTRQLQPDPGCRLYRESLDGHQWLISRSVHSSDSMLPVVVPDGHVFVIGDHRDHSNDSRYFGPIPAALLRGRVLLVD